MDNTQNQNPQDQYNPQIQPDYGFINSYADPTSPKKKSPKLLIAVVAASVLLVGLGALAFLASPESPTPTPQSNTVASENAHIADAVIEPMRRGDVDAVYEKYIKNKAVVSKELFVTHTYEPIVERTSFVGCLSLPDTTVVDPITKQDIAAVRVQCSGEGAYGPQVITIGYIQQGDVVEYRSILIADAREDEL